MTTESYLENFPDAICVPDVVRKRISGEKNPGYQHGGTLSPWSNKSAVHTTEQIISAREKVKQKTISPRKIEHWINKGFDEKTAKQKLTLFQKRDLSFFISKYGDREGKQKHSNKTERWLNTLDMKNEEEKLLINKKRGVAGGKGRGKSKNEQLLFEMLHAHNAQVENQFPLQRIDDPTRSFIYDIRLENKLIEYNGDHWHANPATYTEDRKICSGVVAKDVWTKDALKQQVAEASGFQLLIIWESDFLKNPQSVIELCKNYLR
jgi:hypothetical protein